MYNTKNICKTFCIRSKKINKKVELDKKWETSSLNFIRKVWASFIYLFILLSKNMKIVRQSTLILRLLWTIYDFIVKAYTTFALDIFSLISSLIAIYSLDIKKENRQEDN